MKDIKEVFVIYDPYTFGYYDGEEFRGILFAKVYMIRENAVSDIGNLLSNSDVNCLKIEKLYIS